MLGCLGPHSHPWLPPQRNFSLSVNSVAVLRLMGKGAGPPLGGASRGRGSTRSRGRGGDGMLWGRRSGGLGEVIWQVSHTPFTPPGRGRGDSCFYQRSIEEGDGAFGRNPREIQRSQSWDDRCRLGRGGREGPTEGGWVFVIRGLWETCQISPGQRALSTPSDPCGPALSFRVSGLALGLPSKPCPPPIPCFSRGRMDKVS